MVVVKDTGSKDLEHLTYHHDFDAATSYVM